MWDERAVEDGRVRFSVKGDVRMTRMRFANSAGSASCM